MSDPKFDINRNKRGIIPVVGDILSSLFGVATTRNLNELKTGLSKLQDNQVKIVDVVDKSLSLLNKTHTEVSQNRKALNKLTNATAALHNFVEDVKFKVLSMGPLVAFDHLQSKIHHIFHVVFSSLRQTY